MANNRETTSNEPYQTNVKKGYVNDRNQYLKGGPVATSAGGSPYTEKPPNSRALSAPPIGEEVESESFEKKPNLNSKFWIDNQLCRKTARRLEKIANDFIEELDVFVPVEEVRFTGSLANYNWSKYSDIDLHIVVDFSKIDEDTELVKSFFDAARLRWNDLHDIKIHGYEVEIYVENLSDDHRSSGIYSITDRKWITEPNPESVDIDYRLARRKSNDIETQINLIKHVLNRGKYKVALSSIDRVKGKIRNLRKAGLDSPQQEYSAENIAFKILRREDALHRLADMKLAAYDSLMSTV